MVAKGKLYCNNDIDTKLDAKEEIGERRDYACDMQWQWYVVKED